MHPCAPNVGQPAACCDVKYLGDKPVADIGADGLGGGGGRCIYIPSYAKWGASSTSRVRNGDALVGGVNTMGVGWDLLVPEEKIDDLFDERVRAEYSGSESSCSGLRWCVC